ncbi:MAG: right-handed parallel beta-helix repeat-containing protein [Pirellulaceae bacterium]
MKSSIAMKLLFAIVLLSSVFGNTLIAQEPALTIEVHPDANALQNALTSVKKLRSEGMREPVTLRLDAGVFECDKAIHLGPELVGDGLTLLGTGDGDVVISGGRRLVGEGRDSDGRWRYAMPDGWRSAIGIPRVLLIDSQMRSAARWPHEGYLRIERSLPDRRSGFTVKPNDLPMGFHLNDDVTCDLILLHDWSSSRMPVASYDSDSRVLRTRGPIGNAAAHYAIDHFEQQPRYWLEGHPTFASSAKDWYIDHHANQVVVIAEAESDVEPEVILPWSEQLLVIQGETADLVRKVTLQNLTFTASRFPMPEGGLAGSQATAHERRKPDGGRDGGREMLSAAVHIEQADSARLLNCRFESLGNSGLWLGGRTRESTVQRCRFRHIGGNAINAGETNDRRIGGRSWYQAAPEQVPRNIRITGCDIRHCGELLPGSVAIWAGFQDSISIDGNLIRDCPYTGISLGWMWNPSETPARNNLIKDNRIEYVMQVLSDGGGIYTLGRQPGTVIENNVITDIPLNAGRAESNGIFMDEGTTGIEVRGNTFRRIDRSPLRFHRAGENIVHHNRWELADGQPAIRFNSTPETNVSSQDNDRLAPEPSYYLIGNSLTWDTVPSLLDGNVHWHVDCGKSLPYIESNPLKPCVESSRIWPVALSNTKHDFLSVQTHYGATLDEDVATILRWMALQPDATVIVHTGWARSATRAEEYAQRQPNETMSHSPAYVAALIARLKQAEPTRTIRQTHAIDLLDRVAQDISEGTAPWKSIEEIYRDAIHMKQESGRYLMHNAMRAALNQPLSAKGFENTPEGVKSYLNRVLKEVLSSKD